MLIAGSWMVGPDGRRRPTIRAAIELAQQQVGPFAFLVDPGSDQMVFTFPVWQALGSPSSKDQLLLDGVGGSVSAVELNGAVILTREDGSPVRVTGPFACYTAPSNLEFCILGRDVLNNFDVILSYRRGHVFLLAPNHHY